MQNALPIVVFGVLGALSVVAANSWMNSPAGYTLSQGKITSIDMDQKMIVVAGEKDQSWTLYWNETTRVKGAKVEDLKAGDTIHFDYKEKDGKMWATEIHRSKAAM